MGTSVCTGLWHTAASLAVAEGANVKAVQRMLGHAPAVMTLDVYVGLFEGPPGLSYDRRRAVRERLRLALCRRSAK